MRPRAVAHVAAAMVENLTPSTSLSFLSLFERGHELLRRNGAIALVEPGFERLHGRVARAVDLRRHPTMFAETVRSWLGVGKLEGSAADSGSFTEKLTLRPSARRKRNAFPRTLIARSPHGKSSVASGYFIALARSRPASDFGSNGARDMGKGGV